MKIEPKGQEASRLRQKKFATLRALEIPEDALPGSLALCHRRCGKPTCHCAKGEGHPIWMLTYMRDGKRSSSGFPTSGPKRSSDGSMPAASSGMQSLRCSTRTPSCSCSGVARPCDEARSQHPQSAGLRDEESWVGVVPASTG
jgi:hypothetical protein